MAERFKFTQERIRNLPTPKAGRMDYYDTKVPKLTCRVSSTGNKSFVVLKKNAIGKVQRVTLGRFPDWSVDRAQKEAENVVIPELAQGINPAEKKRLDKIKKITLSKLMNKYIEQKGLKLSSRTAADYQKN